MQTIAVYRFQYFDRRTLRFELAEDYATERAIGSIAGRILRETERHVPVGQVHHNGYLIRPKP